MSLRDYWAYDFACDLSLEQMKDAFNASGGWQWLLGDSAWYGDYLKCRPVTGVRLRVHQYPQQGDGGTFTGLQGEGFSALLEIEDGSPGNRRDVDATFRDLLQRVNAKNVTAIEHYD